ncbi:ankyrin repeat-containing protein NPR4-like [Corylus avellana]|uniref:ankyrin repeat-containing protein NPR4-like n=1 Tax=Corylus avellana TaxID=13451 RepID=UPI00286AC5C2|nr:ankyrin repeat-containing protein NPR4-like [Corylus avellana]
MRPEDLELQTRYGFTALHFAAQVGNVKIAQLLVNIHNKAVAILDRNGDTPLIVAASLGRTNVASYLFSLSSTPLEQLNDEKRIELLLATISNDMYDIALKILKMDPNIANADTKCCWEALTVLARKPFAIGSEMFKGMYNKTLMKTLAHQLVEKLLKKDGIPENMSFPNAVHSYIALIFEAAKVGNVEFLIILVRAYPTLTSQLDNNNMSIFHIAILYRQESVFNLIYEIGADKDRLASYATLDYGDNMLHLAGKLAPLDRLNIVSGAAIRMQREVLWFKEIEKIMPRSFVNMKNSEGKTPKDIFKMEHEVLKREAEMWMKDVSNNCMVVATLIAAVVFAATFTVPGGNNQEIGTPIFLRSTWFIVFFISNAIALFSSTSSMLFFLSVFMSRYSEEDFSVSVPSKLLLGLATLLISIVCMIVAFSAACILMYKSASSWAPVIASASVGIPLTLFSMGHCPELFVDLFLSQYQSRFLFRRPYKPRLFLQKTPVDQEWIHRKYEMQVKRKG